MHRKAAEEADSSAIGDDDNAARRRLGAGDGQRDFDYATLACWADQVRVVCNAAEGELATFKDRFILRRNGAAEFRYDDEYRLKQPD